MLFRSVQENACEKCVHDDSASWDSDGDNGNTPVDRDKSRSTIDTFSAELSTQSVLLDIVLSLPCLSVLSLLPLCVRRSRGAHTHTH